MRHLLFFLVLFAALAGGVWWGGPAVLAWQLRDISQGADGFHAQQITEIHDLTQAGVSLRGVTLNGPLGTLHLPEAALWLTPSAPMTLRLGLPAQASIDLGAGPQPLTIASSESHMRLNPLGRFAPRAATLRARDVTLGGAALLSGLALQADLAPGGEGVPAGTGASYDITFDLHDLHIAAPLPDAISIGAKARLWLDGAPTPFALARGHQPALTGLRLDQASLRIGALTARATGQIEADENGRARGTVAVYTTDANALLRWAADAGLIPNAAIGPAGIVMRAIGSLPIPEDSAPGSTAPTMIFPPARGNEMRLPITMADGRMSLGPVTLGAAPLLRP